MNDEIKEILDRIETASEIFDCLLKPEECTELLDYITNLQQENKRLKEQINQYENPDDMTLFYMWLDAKAKDKMKDLQQENERLNNCIDDQERVINSLIDKRDLYKINYNDYKSRCEKAIEYINNYCIDDEYYINLSYKEKAIIEVLNILQSGDDKE